MTKKSEIQIRRVTDFDNENKNQKEKQIEKCRVL